VPEGLRLTAENIRDFVADSELLLSKGHNYHAIALAIFAFEELGKYAELKKLQEQVARTGRGTIQVKDDLFTRHDCKQNIARQLVSVDSVIVNPAYFDKTYFDSTYFDTEGVPITPHLRAECVFVDWLDEDWKHGTPNDATQIKKFQSAILDALKNLGG
jgi:AbiV family abortive infection protein